VARWRRLEPGALLGVVLLAHLVLALVLGARALGLLERLELQAYDAWLGWRAAASPPEERIVIVPISDADWQGWMGQRFLPDRELADVLEALGEAGAVAIGLDLIRDRPEPGVEGGPDDHDRLARVLETHPSIIGVWGLGGEDARGIAPPPSLAERPERVGLGDMLVDGDGVVRRAPLFLNGHKTLAFQLAERWLEQQGIHPRPGEGTLRLLGQDYTPLRLGSTTYVALAPSDGGYASSEPGGYQLLLSYPACAQPLPAIPLRRLLDEPAAFAPAVAGRLVLLGSKTTEQKDWFQTPVACHGPARRLGWGVDLHAQITSQLIREALDETRPLMTLGQALRDPVRGQVAEVGWIWLWTLMGGVAIVALPPVAALAGAVVLAGTLLAATLALLVSPGWWLPVVPPLLGLAGAMALGLGYLLGRERRQWAILLDRISAYISRRLVDMVAGRRGEPETREVIATVLFSDIRGSTAIAEALPEPELMGWLNEYMSVMADLVLGHGGEIEKFAGDGITATFGMPEDQAGETEIAAAARGAVDCALAMGRELARLNALWQGRDLPAIGIRIGIHTGPLMVGNLGSRQRMQYSIIGDTANTAARLEAWGKDDEAAKRDPDHCRILISEATWQRLGEGYDARPVGPLQLKGKRLPMEVFRVVGGPLPAAPPQERERACRV
jgi:adenylate cyclase